jgi:hypothetical protein
MSDASAGFGWQRHCADRAVEAVREAHGRDIWAELGGSPRSWKACAALYRRMGVRTIDQAVTAVLGAPHPTVRHAHRGDIALVQGSLGIVRGDLIECLGGDGESVMLAIGAASKAWSAQGTAQPPHSSGGSTGLSGGQTAARSPARGEKELPDFVRKVQV